MSRNVHARAHGHGSKLHLRGDRGRTQVDEDSVQSDRTDVARTTSHMLARGTVGLFIKVQLLLCSPFRSGHVIDK